MSSLLNSIDNIHRRSSFLALDNVSADVNLATAAAYTTKGGNVLFTTRATSYGSGTVGINISSASDEDARYTPVEEGAFTAAANKVLTGLPKGTLIKITFSGSSGASDVFAALEEQW